MALALLHVRGITLSTFFNTVTFTISEDVQIDSVSTKKLDVFTLLKSVNHVLPTKKTLNSKRFELTVSLTIL